MADYLYGLASGVALMMIVSAGTGMWVARHPRVLVRQFLRKGRSS